MRIRSRESKTRHGYTLLELLLALGLSVVVVVAIGMAIQVYLIALTKQQANIERKTNRSKRDFNDQQRSTIWHSIQSD